MWKWMHYPKKVIKLNSLMKHNQIHGKKIRFVLGKKCIRLSSFVLSNIHLDRIVPCYSKAFMSESYYSYPESYDSIWILRKKIYIYIYISNESHLQVNLRIQVRILHDTCFIKSYDSSDSVEGVATAKMLILVVIVWFTFFLLAVSIFKRLFEGLIVNSQTLSSVWQD